MADDSRQTGLVIVHTGDGKGKTTAALGLALRAIGHGMRVRMVQFVKAQDTGEHRAAPRLAPEFQIVRSNGISATRAEYLAHLPEVSSFRQSDFVVTRHGDSLVVRNNAIVDVVVDGQQSAGTSSPRLSTFRKDPRTGSWRMVAHGNFVPFS